MNVGATALPNLEAQRGAVRRVLDVLPSIEWDLMEGPRYYGQQAKE